MKKFITYGLFLAILIGLAAPVFADVRTELETKRAEIKTQIKENQDKLKEARKDIKNNSRERINEARTEFRFDIAKHRANIVGRIFNASIRRLERIIERIGSRVTKLNTAGADTTSVTSYVNLAKGNIADAKTHMNVITSLDVSTTTLATTTARQNWDTVKSEARIVKDFLVKAKQNLQKAVNVLAKLQRDHRTSDEDSSNASSTNPN